MLKQKLFLLDVLIGFEYTNYTVRETVGQVMINITVVSGILTRPISIVVSMSDGTARGRHWTLVAQKLFVVCTNFVDIADYISVAANLKQLTPQDSSTIISIEIVNDNITEAEENFTVALASSSPEVGISPSSTVITIQDDDSQGRSVVPMLCYCPLIL